MVKYLLSNTYGHYRFGFFLILGMFMCFEVYTLETLF